MQHGGDLGEAAKRFGRARSDWLDLSTGIGPLPYPYEPPTAEAWRKLPQADALDALLTAARLAYGAKSDAPIIAAPGTQSLIQMLPLARPSARVAIVGPTYSEHSSSWRRMGTEVIDLVDLDCPRDAKVVVVVNPNNPDGRSWSPDEIMVCAEAMAARGGFLIVDEAFADVAPEISAAPQAGAGGLIVLRSFGKFFGLAGIRLGFALGPRSVIEKLDRLLGPWAVSGPAIEIGIQAFSNLIWQATARDTYRETVKRLDLLLSSAGLKIVGGTDLFRLVSHPCAWAVHERLAARDIWARRFDDAPNWLRFGLPGSDAEFSKLAAALGVSEPLSSMRAPNCVA